MKSLLSICFAGILLFNLCGYRLVIDILQDRRHQELTLQIDAGIDDADLISIKLPLDLPYYTNSKDFQWVKGQVTIDGTVYRYVKRRIYNDSIEYRCLRDAGTTRLQNARDYFFLLSNDLTAAQNKKPQQAAPEKILLLEYCQLDRPFQIESPLSIAVRFTSMMTIDLPKKFYPVSLRPPDVFCGLIS